MKSPGGPNAVLLGRMGPFETSPMVLTPSSEGGDQRRLKTPLSVHKALQHTMPHSCPGSSSQFPLLLLPVNSALHHTALPPPPPQQFNIRVPLILPRTPFAFFF